MTLPAVYGGTETGMMYYCCSPCVCDTQDFLMVDTMTIQMAGESKQAHFVVIGNPCKDQAKIPFQAPDVKCESNEDLVKATLSDHGHIIIGMFFEPGIKDHSDSAVQKTDQSEFATMCQGRANAGHQSGMGMIFRQVAAITPIQLAQVAQVAQEGSFKGGAGVISGKAANNTTAAEPGHASCAYVRSVGTASILALLGATQ